MKSSSLVNQIVWILAFVLAQVFFFGKFHLWEYAYCFIFVTLLISLPASNGKITNLIICFLIGLFIDAFNDTPGINAFCSISIYFIRDSIYQAISGKNDEEIRSTSFSISGLGILNFGTLLIISVFLYSLLFTLINTPGWHKLGYNILQTLASTIFTVGITLSLNIIFFSKN